MTTTLSVWLSTKTVSRKLTAERVEKWVKQISEELHLDEILNA
ncbi:flavodoxin 1 [Escherichia coli]|uniref:Flavodoxin 1 n=1 Tax=Escherichia coli TaxID=562 RepID=A0A2X1N2A7_ECOLX|nr:flavodoxin 1 [Escherichia coli]